MTFGLTKLDARNWGRPRAMRSVGKVAIITNMPSYYQVDLFNRFNSTSDRRLKVFYLRETTPGRQWKTSRPIDHDHEFIHEIRLPRGAYLSPGLLRSLWLFDADTVIITQYSSIAMQTVMYVSSLLRRPWVFWCERPHVEWMELPTFRSEALGRGARRVALGPVRKWPTEVWGIGRKAVEWYRDNSRAPVRSFPYFSDLATLLAISRPTSGRTKPPRFLFAGKLVPRKGIDLVLHSTESLIREGVSFELSIAGDGDLRPQVMELADRHPSRVKYEGFKEIDEMPDLFMSADVLLCPSRYDGWGMVVVEAMASGMPVIATTTTGSAEEILVQHKNGWLVPGGSQGSLQAAMRAFAGGGYDLPTMGGRAREAATRYDISEGAQQLDRYLSDLENP